MSQRHRLLGHIGSNSCLSSRMFSAYFKINFVYPAKLVQSASIASAGHHRHSTMGSSSVGSSNNGAHAPWSASGSDEPGSGGEHTASRYRTPMTASSMRASRRRLNRRSVMPVSSDHSQLSDQVDEGVSFQAVCAVNANTPPSWRGVLALHADRKARWNDNAVVMRVDVAAVSTLRDGEVRVFTCILSPRIRAPRPSQFSDLVDEGVSFQAMFAVNANMPPSWQGVLAIHVDRKARRTMLRSDACCHGQCDRCGQ